MKIDDLGIIAKLFSVRLGRIDYLLTRASVEARADYKLRTGTFGVMSLVLEYPGISQNEIARHMQFDKSGINAIINGLERRGWAERRTSVDDRRRHSLHLTDEGKSALQEIIERTKQVEERMLADVPQPILDELCALLDIVHTSCLTTDQP